MPSLNTALLVSVGLGANAENTPYPTREGTPHRATHQEVTVEAALEPTEEEIVMGMRRAKMKHQREQQDQDQKQKQEQQGGQQR